MTTYMEQLVADPVRHYPAATVAAFDPTLSLPPRRSLDIARTQAFVERLADAGAPAVLIGASTGHGHLRTVDELSFWFSVAAATDRGDMVMMALLRPEDGQAANEKLLDHLANFEYSVVFFRPGTNLPATADDDQIVAHLAPLVAAAARRNRAIGLYSIPDVSGVRLTAAAAARLVASPGGERIVAAKITEADYAASTHAYLQEPGLERLKIVQGWDPFIATALREGGARVGVTSGPMSFALFQYLHLLEAAQREDWDEVAAATSAVTQLFTAMQDDPGKFADLQRAKYIMGLGHPLLGEVTDSQVERVLAALAALPRADDRRRLARSLDLMQKGPYHARLCELATT
jgi:dihydrodipicolinate synthase/N-acetylneuraminate lyase